MHLKLSLLLLLVLFAQTSFSQTLETKIETKTETEVSAELKKQAVEFLRESAIEVGNLRTLENRISFSSEMASLMWFHDEKEARAMMNAVVGDFKQLILQYDAQLTALGGSANEEDPFVSMFSGDQNEKARLTRKLARAMSVRQQIALSIAEHDPQLALDFFAGSLQTIANAQARKRFEEQDVYFEARLINEIAEKNPAKALEAGRKTMAKGLSRSHLELLKKIYARDADKGAEFGAEIAGKLKSDKVAYDDYYMLGEVLSLGSENLEKAKKDGKKPMFAEQDLRDVAEVYAKRLLQIAGADMHDLASQANLIEKFAPARAIQIRAKMTTKTQSGTGGNIIIEDVASPPPISKSSGKMSNDKDEQEEMMKSLQNLDAKKLPKEEREKVIGQARKIIASLPNKQAKILALSGLAGQVAKLGDKELAGQIMTDARALTNPQPKNYLDFMELWLLSSGLAATDAEKAFPVLEDTIFRVNDTLAAFVKVAEFIDVSGEMIDDGEVQVGGFGGSMVRELTRGLGQADTTIMNLARADFARTKNLTNKFDRQEVRILAKMLVLRAILGDKNKTATEEN
ncbi:MAG TPA: hypothetical protein VF692_02355 [Pyrinomonadaceae bacterium]